LKRTTSSKLCPKRGGATSQTQSASEGKRVAPQTSPAISREEEGEEKESRWGGTGRRAGDGGRSRRRGVGLFGIDGLRKRKSGVKDKR